MKYLIEEITLNDIIYTIELELEIACFCEEVEIEDFTVLNVNVETYHTGREYTIDSDRGLLNFYNTYKNDIQKELGNDDTLINQVEDYLQDEKDEYLISNYEDNKQAQIDHWEMNNY